MAQQNSSQLEAVLVVRDEMSGPLQRAKGEITKLGAAFSSLQQKASASLKTLTTGTASAADSTSALAASFGRAEVSQARLVSRFARLTAAIVGLDTLTRALGNTLGRGDLGQGVKVATDALGVFAGTVAIMPNKIGLAVGAVAGLGIAFSGLVGPSADVAAALDAVNKRLDKLRAARAGLEQSGNRSNIENKIRQGAGFGATDLERVTAERARLLEKAVGLQEELDLVVKDPALILAGGPLSGKTLDGLRKELAETEAALKGVADKVKELEADTARNKGLDELTGKVKTLWAEADLAKVKLEAGLISPVEAAEVALKATESAIKDLIAARDLLSEADFNESMGDLTETAKKEKAKLEGLKAQEKQQKQIADEMERAAEAFRQQWVGIFEDLKSGFSEVFADALLDGKDFAKGLGSIFKELQRSMIKMVLETSLGGMFRAGGNSLAAAMGGGGGGVGGGAGGSVNTSSASGFLGLGGGGGGGSLAGLGIGVGTAAGGYVMNRGIQTASPGTSAAGGALAGAAMGAVFGPVGIVVGAIAGAALGWYQGNEAKKEEEKMKAAAAEQAAEAERQHKAMVEKAKGLIKMHIRNNYAGGLGTEEAMKDISGLFSNDISAEEVEKFGAENVVARQSEIEGAAGMQVSVGGITVNAQVSGDYDVSRLAESLGYHLQRSIQSAAAGASS